MTSSDNSRCARAGEIEAFTTPPSVPPIFQTTAFDVADLDQLQAISAGEQHGYIYTRDRNPNHDAFARAIAELDGGEAGVACSSGMGALAAIVLAHVESGDHLIVARVLYGRSLQLVRHLTESFRVDVTLVDATRPDEFRAAVTPRTKLAIVETLSNPLVEVTDIPAVTAALEHVPLLVDSTFTTPCLLKPIAHGARYVLHSASKHLNGHGDVTLGVVVGPRDIMDRSRELASIFGMNANPFDCWLATRGLRSLPLRMTRISETAHKIAGLLEQHPRVGRVFYPGLTSHPSHATAAALLTRGCGGIVSFEVAGDGRESASRFMRAASAIPFSPTLGDSRTTISHPASTSHRYLDASEREHCGVTDNLLRLSVGLEAADDLQTELEQGLAALR